MMVVAHQQAAHAQLLQQYLLHELARSEHGHGVVKVEHGHGSQPGLFQQLEFLFVRGEQLGPVAGVRQGQTRMLLEGHHHG